VRRVEELFHVRRSRRRVCKEIFRSQNVRKTAIVYNFPKTKRDCVQLLHLYHAKTVNIDIHHIYTPNGSAGQLERRTT
jgi:hypothetical protein